MTLTAEHAETFAPSAAAVVLTGMGRDGAKGMEAVIQVGGAVLPNTRPPLRLPTCPASPRTSDVQT